MRDEDLSPPFREDRVFTGLRSGFGWRILHPGRLDAKGLSEVQ